MVSNLQVMETSQWISLGKNIFCQGVRAEYKDLQKFATDSDSHLSGEELENSFKVRHYRQTLWTL